MCCGSECRRRYICLPATRRPDMAPPAVAGPVVIGKDLRKVFRAPAKGGEVRALDGVSIEVRAGELTALVGPDGAGKTTLIRLMAGLLTADGGILRVLDIDPAVEPQRVQDRIGY